MVKNISTRVQICGRGVGCHGGHSAVEQSGYISREKMYSEYDGNTYSVSYEIKADTKKEYKAVINATRKVGNTTTTVELGNISYNRENNAYTAVIYADDTPVEIKGTLEVSSSRARFTITSVSSNGQDVFSGEFYIVLNAKDTMPSAISKYTDILTMKEEDFQALAEKLQALVPSIEPDYGYDYDYDYDF